VQNHPTVYEVIARGREVHKTVRAIKQAGSVINDALGLTWGMQVDGADDEGMFRVS
jgi:hypothetical protein